jgi:hypothetical protein
MRRCNNLEPNIAIDTQIHISTSGARDKAISISVSSSHYLSQPHCQPDRALLISQFLRLVRRPDHPRPGGSGHGCTVSWLQRPHRVQRTVNTEIPPFGNAPLPAWNGT